MGFATARRTRDRAARLQWSACTCVRFRYTDTQTQRKRSGAGRRRLRRWVSGIRRASGTAGPLFYQLVTGLPTAPEQEGAEGAESEESTEGAARAG